MRVVINNKIRRDETERISIIKKKGVIKYTFGYVLCSRRRMIIQIDECNSIDTNILQIFGKYDRIDKLLEDADKGVIDIQALDCAIKFDNKLHWFRQYGQDDPNRKQWIKKLKKVPLRYRKIPCDTMIVKADVFEQQLFITIGI